MGRGMKKLVRFLSTFALAVFIVAMAGLESAHAVTAADLNPSFSFSVHRSDQATSSQEIDLPAILIAQKRNYSPSQREKIFNRSQKADPGGVARCAYCGKPTTLQKKQPNTMHADHEKSYATGGKTTLKNGRNSCATCNLSKGKKELGTEWIPPNQR